MPQLLLNAKNVNPLSLESAGQVLYRYTKLVGFGVRVGTKVESLYRDIRALRIYEGATEVQQLIIGKSVLKQAGTRPATHPST